MAKRNREKTAKRLENKDRRPQCTAKFIRIAPNKVRIVLNLIRGKSYMDALAILMGTPKAASEPIKKVLESAGANAENNLNLSKTDLFVAEAFANEGATYKRMWPRSHGSADTILKRTSHITVILDEKPEDKIVKPVVTKKVKKEKIDIVEEAVKEVKEELAEEKAETEVKKALAKKAPAKKAPAKSDSKPAAAKTAAKSTTKPAAKKAPAKTTTSKGGAK